MSLRYRHKRREEQKQQVWDRLKHTDSDTNNVKAGYTGRVKYDSRMVYAPFVPLTTGSES